VIDAAGLYLMSLLGVDSSYAGGVLPALVVTAAGLAIAFVPVMNLANGDAEERDGGLASGLMTSAQQIGGAIGIAVMITIATSHTSDAAAGGAPPAAALVEGFQAAFRVEAAVMLAAALLAVLTLRRRTEV
jgi:hypothetical protein